MAPKDVLSHLEIVYKDNSLLYSTVNDCAKRFHEGKDSLEDGFWSGRPKFAVTSADIIEIEWMVEEGPHLTVEEISMHVAISTGGAHTILVDALGISKIVPV